MSFRCGSFSPVVVRNFLSRKPPGLESVCIRSSRITTWPWGFNASRYRHNTYRGAAANHRTASPRRPAPRRSTTTNKPPFCLPFALGRAFFFYFVLFFFFFLYFCFRFYARQYRSITESICQYISALGHGFCNRPMIFLCRVQVGIASTSRRVVFLCEFHRAKVSKKAIRQCRIFLFFFSQR